MLPNPTCILSTYTEKVKEGTHEKWMGMCIVTSLAYSEVRVSGRPRCMGMGGRHAPDLDFVSTFSDSGSGNMRALPRCHAANILCNGSAGCEVKSLSCQQYSKVTEVHTYRITHLPLPWRETLPSPQQNRQDFPVLPNGASGPESGRRRRLPLRALGRRFKFPTPCSLARTTERYH